MSRVHVDLGAYYEGGSYRTEFGDVVTVDDLIICDKCLKEAGAIVGLFPAEDLHKENAELGAALDEKNQQIEAQQTLISDLERTVASATDERIKRPARKPKMIPIGSN